MTLTIEDIHGFRVQGAFDRSTVGDFFLPVRESGDFFAIPDNPAIGPAMAFDVDSDETFDDVYFVLGVRRSSFTGNVTSLCLANAEPETEAPFMMVRIGW